jgi:hypothetical protein
MVNNPTKDTRINLDEVSSFLMCKGSVGFVSLGMGATMALDTLNNPTSSMEAPLTLSPMRHGRGEDDEDRRITKSERVMTQCGSEMGDTQS